MMLDIFARIVRSGSRPRERSRVTAYRLDLERLESRELLTITIPLPPSGVVAAGTSASDIMLTWNASKDPTITGYDVTERTWVVNGGGKGSHGGHYVYGSVATNVPTNSYDVAGLVSGSSHTYLITALNAAGSSLDSQPATGETWIAPSLKYGSTYYQLSNGYESYGPVAATAGMTTQITLYVAGNPLTYSVLSGPKTASIDPKRGFVSFTPTSSEVGQVNITFKASNALGSVTQTIQFNVSAASTNLSTPKLTLSGTNATYTGQYQPISAKAVGTDGVTQVSGSFAFAYDGFPNQSPYAGTYTVLATFTSSDPNYNNATLVGKLTIAKAHSAFSLLTPTTTIAVGTSSTTVSGHVGTGSAYPIGEYVIVTLSGVSVATAVDTNGNFSTSLDTSTLAVGKYTITYAYAGDSNLRAATSGRTTLKVIPTAPPQVTQNPSRTTVTEGDPASFTAAASGVPTPSVQWQVSTDGGATYSDIAGAINTTLTFTTLLSQNGYLYQAVFTNSVGTATTTAALLTVESNTGAPVGNVRIASGSGGTSMGPLDFVGTQKRHRSGLFE